MCRYTPRDLPQAQQFWVSGMVVELEGSDDKTVQLKSVSLQTAGTLMCEVSTEAPRFKTAEASGELTVVQPPGSGPVISPLPGPGERFSPGHLLEINCTSPPSNPQAKLRFFINDQMVGRADHRPLLTFSIFSYFYRMTALTLSSTDTED